MVSPIVEEGEYYNWFRTFNEEWKEVTIKIRVVEERNGSLHVLLCYRDPETDCLTSEWYFWYEISSNMTDVPAVMGLILMRI